MKHCDCHDRKGDKKCLPLLVGWKSFPKKNLENLIRRYHESFMFEICVGEMGRKTTDKNGSIFPLVFENHLWFLILQNTTSVKKRFKKSNNEKTITRFARENETFLGIFFTPCVELHILQVCRIWHQTSIFADLLSHVNLHARCLMCETKLIRGRKRL